MRKYTINRNLPETLPLLLRDRALTCGNLNLQAAKNSDSKYEYFTYAKVYEDIIALSLALKSIGITRGSNIALISDNRREWLISDFAIQSLGCADVPRGCDSMGTEIRFIINFAECQTAFFENEKQLLKVLEKKEEVPLLKTAIIFDEISVQSDEEAFQKGINCINFWQLMEKGYAIFNSNAEDGKALIEEEMSLGKAEDVCTIIFTSGTTGTPKGVMLTHKNYLSQLSSVHNYMSGEAGNFWMSILPVWHSFERLAQYVAILLKCGLAYSKPNARELLKDMSEIQPCWMCGVPRLWEALATGVSKTMQKKGGITYLLYKYFMKIGKQYSDFKIKFTGNSFKEKKPNRFKDILTSLLPLITLFPLYHLGDLFVYRKIRAKFGGKFVYPISGGGALQPETDAFFRAIGFTMVEGYGMTETAPAIAFRDYQNPQVNCVGIPFPTIQVKIVKEENGEIFPEEEVSYGTKGMILVKGDHVMKGYYKRPDLTEKIIDKNGWLNTGDLGELSYNGLLKITGRAKDTIVLLDGENIEPVMIEQALCASEYIESAMVVGQDQKFLASLIVPSKSAIENYAKENQIAYDSYEGLLKNTLIHKMIMKIVNKHVSQERGFRSCEKITKITLIAKSFEVGKELSAKQEMIRPKITNEYEKEIKMMYA